MRRALAIALLALVACVRPQGVCAPARAPSEGHLLGWLDVDGVRWRVQQSELPPACSGVTSWSPFSHAITFADETPDRAIALHEIGHALIGAQHLPDGAGVMSARHPKGQDLTEADVALCRERGACLATQVPPMTLAEPDPIAWAAVRWRGVSTARIRWQPHDVSVTLTVDPDVPLTRPEYPR